MFIKISQNVCKDFRKCFQRMLNTLFVPRHHVGLKFGNVVIAQHDGFVVVVVIFEDGWEEVTGGLAFRVTHGEDGGVGAFGYELVLQAVATAVASDDTADFPELEVV